MDEWGWEKVVTPAERTIDALCGCVKLMYQALLNTEYLVCEHYPILSPFLPKAIHFITSEELLQRYPNQTAKERENSICKEYGAVFICGIGGILSNGEVHDFRAPDYDDWTTPAPTKETPDHCGLNGDILIWYEPLQKAVEISSMGIRVDKSALLKQLEITNHLDWQQFTYHNAIVQDQLPLTIGGGIGQSRLCMLLLHKRHIGEVQASVWDEQMIEDCRQKGIHILQ